VSIQFAHATEEGLNTNFARLVWGLKLQNEIVSIFSCQVRSNEAGNACFKILEISCGFSSSMMTSQIVLSTEEETAVRGKTQKRDEPKDDVHHFSWPFKFWT
jgi:hypothetical protein